MNGFSQQLAADLPTDSGSGPEWARTLRHTAAEQFRTYGLPTRKDEAWKYTGLRALEDRKTRLSSETESAKSSFAEPVAKAGQQVQMLDGRMLELIGELPTAVTMLSLQDAFSSSIAGLQELLESLPTSSAKQLSSDGFQ